MQIKFLSGQIDPSLFPFYYFQSFTNENYKETYEA